MNKGEVIVSLQKLIRLMEEQQSRERAATHKLYTEIVDLQTEIQTLRTAAMAHETIRNRIEERAKVDGDILSTWALVHDWLNPTPPPEPVIAEESK